MLLFIRYNFTEVTVLYWGLQQLFKYIVGDSPLL